MEGAQEVTQLALFDVPRPRTRPRVRMLAITADDIINIPRLNTVIERTGDWPRVVNVVSELLCDLEGARP